MSPLDVERAMEEAVARHQSGDVAGAEAIYRRVLEVAPDDGDALHLLGVITMNSGRVDEAVELLKRATAAQPEVAEFHLDLGRALLALHEPQQAADAFTQATRLDPKLVDAWFLLGKVRAGVGRRQEAADALRRTVELLPAHPAAHEELTNVLLSVPDFDGAVAAAQAVVRLRPGDPAAEFLLGNTLRAAVKLPDAADAYRRALAFDPQYIEAMVHLASVYWAIQRKDEAIELCRQAIRLKPDVATSHYALGAALEKAGHFNEAADAYRQALRLDPGQTNWRFDLAAVSGEPSTAPPLDFVTRLYEEYAPRFESHLVDALQYRGPQQLMTLVQPHVGERRDLDVMDLGCGTGLCGRLFRPMARTMIGVDLSPRMLELSRRHGVYDELINADAVSALRARLPGSLDLILAGDVLIYIGALSGLFAAAAGALRPGGLFAFTIESQEEEGFALRRTRRFTHSLSYVTTTAASAGLEHVESQRVTLRIQEQQPVPAWAVLLKKPR